MYIDQKFYDSDIRRYDEGRCFVYKVFSDDDLKNKFAKYLSKRTGCAIESIDKFCITFKCIDKNSIDWVKSIGEAYDQVYTDISRDPDLVLGGAAIYTMIKYMQDSVSIMPL